MRGEILVHENVNPKTNGAVESNEIRYERQFINYSAAVWTTAYLVSSVSCLPALERIDAVSSEE